MKPDGEKLELIRAAIDGTATPGEMQALQEHLRRDPVLLRLFARYASLDSALGDGRLAEVPPAKAALPTRQQAGFRWLAWRPLAAAAAGLVFGMFCTSVVFAYALPKSSAAVTRLMPLADADFEADSQVPALGIPARPVVWSGDFLRVVAAENGIAPKQGGHMLRFLRSDNELSSKADRSYVGEVAQLVDLRPLRSEFPGAARVVELAAHFNSVATPPGVQYEFTVKAAAFRGDFADAPRLWEDREASGSRSNRSVMADSDVATWQRVAVPLMVPADADFLILECAVVRKAPLLERGAVEFPGHYVDQVELRLGGWPRTWTEARHTD